MKELVMDSCSVILLAKASVLEAAMEMFKILITVEVYDEVLKGKKKMFQDALLVERLYQKQKFLTVQINQELKKKFMKNFRMGAGEAATLAAITDNQIIVTDNRQGRKAAVVNNLLLAGSIEIIVSLYKNKRISYEKCVGAFKILQEEGWFDTYLLEKAMEDVA